MNSIALNAKDAALLLDLLDSAVTERFDACEQAGNVKEERALRAAAAKALRLERSITKQLKGF